MNITTRSCICICLASFFAFFVSYHHNDAQSSVKEHLIHPSILFPSQPRTEITYTQQGIYPAVTLLVQGDTSATGVVIGRDTILTNQHVINKNTDIPLIAYPGATGSSSYPYGQFQASHYDFYPTHDLAIVHLNKNIFGQSIGELVSPVALGDTAHLKLNQPIQLIGFPGDKPLNTMWLSPGKIVGIEQDVLNYDANTTYGNSGSPVFTANNELIAIHYGGVRNLYNSGVLLTPDIQAFIQQHNAY